VHARVEVGAPVLDAPRLGVGFRDAVRQNQNTRTQ
jgi:hypothetical protein